jgi:hypothetical protein
MNKELKELWKTFVIICYATGKAIMYALWFVITLYILSSYTTLHENIYIFGWVGIIGVFFVNIYKNKYIIEEQDEI